MTTTTRGTRSPRPTRSATSTPTATTSATRSPSTLQNWSDDPTPTPRAASPGPGPGLLRLRPGRAARLPHRRDGPYRRLHLLRRRPRPPSPPANATTAGRTSSPAPTATTARATCPAESPAAARTETDYTYRRRRPHRHSHRSSTPPGSASYDRPPASTPTTTPSTSSTTGAGTPARRPSLQLQRPPGPHRPVRVRDGTTRTHHLHTATSAAWPTSITDPRGNASGATAANYTTNYRYDEAGNPTDGRPAPPVRSRRTQRHPRPPPGRSTTLRLRHLR